MASPRLFLCIPVLAAALGLGGCSGEDAPPADAGVITATERIGVYGEGEGPIAVRVGEDFAVQLVAPRGATWRLDTLGNAAVTVTARQQGQGERTLAAERWTLRPTSAGESVLRFDQRTAQGRAAGRSIRFDLVVRGA